ncbi:Protein kinase superfamily protein [Raphanus sativus]|uniref:Non-functional pseudokinase ZRK6 n=1 Tax=Raphanus sativus TaxID=3726 RepID=A0A6J0KGZ1_RAPSA|nr:non-functional pseudokinase ZRK6 [Raphanus sativus]KAJ4885080.1 Protein kinase superfamily protein [Raphanus sativus]
MNWLRTNRIGGAKTRQRNVKENGEVVLKELIECCDGKCNPIKSFPSDQIIKATDNFSQSNRASRIDVYYRCYKGILDDRPVLIKKGKYTLDIKEICRDIAISSMVSGHKNFLKLLGCCLEFTPPVLVFEYAEIITLGPLAAPNPRNMRRIKIAREVASALSYLHTAFSRAFIHSSLDPFTVFLDGNGIAKLGNFCNCVSIPEGEEFVHDDALKKYHEFRTITLKQTHELGVCYLPVIDPEYKTTGKVTTKTDMHSFGAFMLALVQVKEVDDELSMSSDMLRALAELFIKPKDDGCFPLHHHVSKILRKFGYAEVMDSDTSRDVSYVAASPMKEFFRLALRCIGCNLGDPLSSMIQVTKELRAIEKSAYGHHR